MTQQGHHSTNWTAGLLLMAIAGATLVAIALYGLEGDARAVDRARKVHASETPARFEPDPQAPDQQKQASPVQPSEDPVHRSELTARELAAQLIVLVATDDIPAVKAIIEASGEPCAYGASWGWMPDQKTVDAQTSAKVAELEREYPGADIFVAQSPTQVELLAGISVVIALVTCD